MGLYHAFRMSIEDFCKCFCQLDICNYSPAFLDSSPESHWILSEHDGRWLAGSTAGGHMDCKGSYCICIVVIVMRLTDYLLYLVLS